MSVIPGTRRRSVSGHNTFIPNSLPPRFRLTASAEREVEDATHLLGQVEMCRTLLPNADLLVYSSLQREAIASSTIEGTIASPNELLLFQASQNTGRQDVREVANYSHALEWGYEQLPARPIGYGLIVGLHERLLEGVRGAIRAGQIKDQQNYIGSRPTDSIESALFVPPPAEATVALITDLERYINNPGNNESRIVQCALAHYQFETIHPFSDSNGRVGRLLIILQMIQLGLLSAPLIYPSVYFEHNRQTYYQLLQAVRERGEWERWIEFFVRGIKQQCSETILLTRTILQLREQLRQEISNARRRASLGEVLTVFFEQPVLPIGEISRRANIARNSAQAALDILQDRGMVAELTGRKRDRVYACLPVLRVVFGSEAHIEVQK